LWVWTGSTWHNVGEIRGPQGATGLTGSTGPQGPAGATGIGATGSTGPQGATGIQGATGLTGDVAGYTGTFQTGNVSLYQTVSTTSANRNYYVSIYDKSSGNAAAYTDESLIYNPNNNTLTVQNITVSGAGIIRFDNYQFANGTSIFGGLTSGATGPSGLQGATGATGTIGNNGTDGATGATGPAGNNGATGPQGATGVGATGPTGATGLTGTNVGVSNTAPSTPSTGDLWYDDVGGRMYVYYNGAWVDANPEGNAINTVTVPVHNNSAGAVGQIAYDSTYIYICVATDTWVRSALAATW
jgi:hypothetical protein